MAFKKFLKRFLLYGSEVLSKSFAKYDFFKKKLRY